MPRQRTRLTQLQVDRLKPTGEAFEESDGPGGIPGFQLRVGKSGTKTFTLIYRAHGRQRRLKLGRHPTMSLADARTAARAALERVERGEDPADEQARRREDRNTVAAVATDYMNRHVKRNCLRWRDVERMLHGAVLPHWGKRSIETISRRDVLDLVDDIADRAPVMANRVLAQIKRLFAWAIERGIPMENPAEGIRRPHRERARDRVLSDDELRAVWNAAEQIGWPFGPITQLLALLGQRRSEIAGMKWDDLDLGRRLWTLPAASTKAQRIHEVPLPDMAVEIIEALPRVLGQPHVFPARMGNGTVSGFGHGKARLDVLCGFTGWTHHNLRRTAASGMAKLGQPPHVVSAILNHAPGSTLGPISAIYNRHRYADEKRAALDAWARYVERLVTGTAAQVVPLRRSLHT